MSDIRRLGSHIINERIFQVGDKVKYGSGEAAIVEFFSVGEFSSSIKVLLYTGDMRPYHWSPSSIHYSDVEYGLRNHCLDAIEDYFGEFYEEVFYDRKFTITFDVFIEPPNFSKINKNSSDNQYRLKQSNHKLINLEMPTGLKINHFNIFDSSTDILQDIEKKYSESFQVIKK